MYILTNNGVVVATQASPIKYVPEQYAWQLDGVMVCDTDKLMTAGLDLPSSAKAALLKIDADTDDLYGSVLGNRAEEYTSAADDAAAYKLAGYAGTVPPGVQSWATAKGWTATKAADDILATSAAWVTAQNGIRAKRLATKEQVRAATSAAGISTVLISWAGFVAYMRGQLGL